LTWEGKLKEPLGLGSKYPSLIVVLVRCATDRASERFIPDRISTKHTEFRTGKPSAFWLNRGRDREDAQCAALTEGVVTNRAVRIESCATISIIMNVVNTSLPLDRQPIGQPEHRADPSANDVTRATGCFDKAGDRGSLRLNRALVVIPIMNFSAEREVIGHVPNDLADCSKLAGAPQRAGTDGSIFIHPSQGFIQVKAGKGASAIIWINSKQLGSSISVKRRNLSEAGLAERIAVDRPHTAPRRCPRF
jgi:hypothetical protein